MHGEIDEAKELVSEGNDRERYVEEGTLFSLPPFGCLGSVLFFL